MCCNISENVHLSSKWLWALSQTLFCLPFSFLFVRTEFSWEMKTQKNAFENHSWCSFWFRRFLHLPFVSTNIFIAFICARPFHNSCFVFHLFDGKSVKNYLNFSLDKRENDIFVSRLIVFSVFDRNLRQMECSRRKRHVRLCSRALKKLDADKHRHVFAWVRWLTERVHISLLLYFIRELINRLWIFFDHAKFYYFSRQKSTAFIFAALEFENTNKN